MIQKHGIYDIDFLDITISDDNERALLQLNLVACLYRRKQYIAYCPFTLQSNSNRWLVTQTRQATDDKPRSNNDFKYTYAIV